MGIPCQPLTTHLFAFQKLMYGAGVTGCFEGLYGARSATENLCEMNRIDRQMYMTAQFQLQEGRWISRCRVGRKYWREHKKLSLNMGNGKSVPAR